jgi:hypothetical protein
VEGIIRGDTPITVDVTILVTHTEVEEDTAVVMAMAAIGKKQRRTPIQQDRRPPPFSEARAK